MIKTKQLIFVFGPFALLALTGLLGFIAGLLKSKKPASRLLPHALRPRGLDDG